MEEINDLFAMLMGFMFGILLEGIVDQWIRKNVGKKKRKKDKEHPCATCLRWEECNGTDEECPMIREEKE